ncbi:hypothetical protein ACEN88_26885, partial [Massilia sp. CT11-108]|uniref:hypothetical protein n=1 Tax=Massilia sp. CT11-108 TaxID=3393900 RepID=UPI0039A6D087
AETAASAGSRWNSGRTAPSFGEQVLMLCAHFAPTSGRHTAGALAFVRAGVLLLPLLFLGWLWRRGGRRAS